MQRYQQKYEMIFNLAFKIIGKGRILLHFTGCMLFGYLVLNHNVVLCAEPDTASINKLLKDAISFQKTNPDTALALTNKAYQIALKYGDQLLLAAPYYTFASIYYYSNNQQLALDYFFKALKQLEENTVDKESTEYLKRKARIYCNIGICCYYLKMNNLALSYCEKSFSLIDETNRKKPGVFSSNQKMFMLYNVGSMLLDIEEYDKAIDYLLKAQDINRTLKDSLVKAELMEALGQILSHNGKEDEALANYMVALEIWKKVNDKRSLASVYLNIGNHYLNKNDLNNAKKYLLMAISYGSQTSLWKIIQRAADQLTRIYVEGGDYKNAFKMQQLNIQLNDSIFNSVTATNVTRLTLQYEYDRKIKIQEIKQQKEIDRQKNRKIFFILVSTILLLLIVMVVLLLLNQRKKVLNALLKQNQLSLESKNIRLEKEKLESDLTFKNKELATNVMYLVQKNEFITDIAHQAKDLIARQPEEARQEFAKLVGDLQRNTDDKVWKEFEVRFQEVHQEFYRRLNKKFPHLTPNEKKLAAFLRLNMSTKDISAITFQSPSSIKIARSRLRKKMDLNSGENLIAFLENI
jgi:tetratricopeptide (TPR) repeat protein